MGFNTLYGNILWFWSIHIHSEPSSLWFISLFWCFKYLCQSSVAYFFILIIITWSCCLPSSCCFSFFVQLIPSLSSLLRATWPTRPSLYHSFPSAADLLCLLFHRRHSDDVVEGKKILWDALSAICSVWKSSPRVTAGPRFLISRVFHCETAE